jgi:ubiquitin thioesterase ZRANB1
MNASSCKQCNTKLNSQCLNDPVDLEDEAYAFKAEEPLKISELAEFGSFRESTRRPNCSPLASPNKMNTLPKGAEKCSSRSNSPNNTNNANRDKWTCPVCTYDNWPRSVKCIMCMSGDQAMSLGPNEVSNGSLYSQTNFHVDSVITPSLGNLSLGVSNCSSAFETSSYENNAVNTNYTDTMRMRLFRGNETDRRWLDACCGAVEGNIQAVEEYLTSGGDPTRQLNEAEVLFLDRPSAFDIGFTLIHLALR